MTDINLLQDTKGEKDRSQQKAKKQRPPPLAYSSPELSSHKESQLKKPSGIGLWFRSLFGKRFKSPRQRINLPPKPAPAQPQAKTSPSLPAGAEDIFANLEPPPSTSREQRPSASEVPQATTGLPPRVSGMTPSQPQHRPSSRPASGIPTEIAAGQGYVPSLPPVAVPRPSTPSIRPQPRPVQPLGLSPAHGLLSRKRALKKPPQEKPEKEEPSEVNLLPEELVTTFDPRKKMVTMGLVALSAALLVGITDVGLILWKTTQVRKTDERRTETQEIIRTIKGLEQEQRNAIAFKASNDAFRQILNRHVYFTKFLENFEKYTLPEVFYSGGLSIDVGGNLTITGFAPDIETINKQQEVYEGAKDFVESVKIETITRSQDRQGYSFVANLKFLSGSFYRPIDSTTIQESQSRPGNSATNTNANLSL